MKTYHTSQGTLTVTPGAFAPYGAMALHQGINFAVSSSSATGAWLVLFKRGDWDPFVEIPFSAETMKTGDVYHMFVEGVAAETIEYGFRFDGPNQPSKGHRFDRDKILMDPYAREVTGRTQWRQQQYEGNGYPLRSAIPTETFDWEGDRPLNLPFKDLIIYEMHVRSFTAHPSAGVEHGGTYAGLIEKIPYLQTLGVNCVELMPVQEFDEFESTFSNPETGERLLQYWGYGTTAFFSPKISFAAQQNTNALHEFKQMVKSLHSAGIEVILDVVFNHTAEGSEQGHTISFRGIDNKTWYLLNENGEYLNYSGTGNSLNCNHPVVARMIVDCLRFWVTEYHIDGFRFDLASILTRGQDGAPLASPPVVEAIAKDPVLANTKLIAEAWDAAGLYQVGSFPNYKRWSEWNGRYRDNLRRFVRGDQGQTGGMVQQILGSPDLYKKSHGSAVASINFITSHDGFTLRDLYSYNGKHNLINGEDNRDGANDNNSWNSGTEGETDDPDIRRLRLQLAKNGTAILLLSRGVPMLQMGDELWHTKYGNNNTWGQDNDLNWVNWESLHEDEGAEMFRFTQLMIAFRKNYAALRREHYPGEAFQQQDRNEADIVWHGVNPYHPDWAWHSHTLAFSFLCYPIRIGDSFVTPTIYVAMNMHWQDHNFNLPQLAENYCWYELANTGRPSPHDIHEVGQGVLLESQNKVLVAARSLVILVGRTDQI